MLDSSADGGLTALFLASFLAATILPGGSELVLIGVLHEHPDSVWQAIAVATIGNTLGGASSYWIGRLIPNKARSRAIDRVQRWGYWALLMSWVPLVGDALCLAAGWLRLSFGLSLIAFAVGKFARYAVVAAAWLGWS